MIDCIYVFLVLLLITGINYFVLIIYFIIGWFKIKVFNIHENKINTKVSIILPFRNEENNILNVLECLLKQDFPNQLMEIILIDDHSTDLSLAKANLFKETHTNNDIKIIELKTLYPNIGSKKLALKEGIALSNGELIISTDADCIMNSNWLKYIVSYYEKYNPNMIVAPVCFINDHKLFEHMQHLEFLSLQAIGMSSVGIKHPILANGANLAYKRDGFNAVNGFKSNENIASGDDVFLLHQINKAFPDTIHYIKSYEALVYTNPQIGIRKFMSQRKRWASKSKYYQDIFAKYVAISVFLFNFLLLMALFLSLFQIKSLLFFGILFTVKLFIDFLLLCKITKFVKRRKLLLLVPILDLFYIFYVVFISGYSLVGNYKWKGRQIKN